MPMPDHVQRARADLTARMRVAVERQAARAGIQDKAPNERVRLYVNEPHVLSVSVPHGERYDLALAPALDMLARLPPRVGNARIREALGEARESGRMRVHPRNDPNWLQPGDRLGDGTVAGILVGRDYQGAKTGDPVDCLPRVALERAYEAERVFVLLDGHGGYGRRGTQVRITSPAKGSWPGREGVRALRRGQARIEAMVRRTERAIVSRECYDGTASLLLDLVGIAAAGRRLMEAMTQAPAATVDREERTRMRQLDAALGKARDRLVRLARFHHAMDSDRDTKEAVALFDRERGGLAMARRLVRARIDAARPEAGAAGPRP